MTSKDQSPSQFFVGRTSILYIHHWPDKCHPRPSVRDSHVCFSSSAVRLRRTFESPMAKEEARLAGVDGEKMTCEPSMTKAFGWGIHSEFTDGEGRFCKQMETLPSWGLQIVGGQDFIYRLVFCTSVTGRWNELPDGCQEEMVRQASLGTDFGPPWRVVTNILIF